MGIELFLDRDPRNASSRDQIIHTQGLLIFGDSINDEGSRPRSFIIDRITEYQETLGMNYLIARGRIPGVSVEEQLDSHEALLALSNS